MRKKTIKYKNKSSKHGCPGAGEDEVVPGTKKILPFFDDW